MKTLTTEEQKKQRDRYTEMRRLRLDDDLKWLMSTEQGRRMAYYIIFELSGLTRLTFDPNVRDGICASLHQANADGRRLVGSLFLGQIEAAAPEQRIAMMLEQIRVRQADGVIGVDTNKSAGDQS